MLVRYGKNIPGASLICCGEKDQPFTLLMLIPDIRRPPQRNQHILRDDDLLSGDGKAHNVTADLLAAYPVRVSFPEERDGFQCSHRSALGSRDGLYFPEYRELPEGLPGEIRTRLAFASAVSDGTPVKINLRDDDRLHAFALWLSRSIAYA